MPNRHHRIPYSGIFLWMLLLLTSVAEAQSPDEKNKPLLPTELKYTSPLINYQPYTDQPIQSWREANDQVGHIGGWRAYAKEMQTEETSKKAPANNPHAAHEKGKQP